MKITKEELAGSLERAELFLRHYGRLYSITALTTSMEEANAHMAAHESESLLREHQGFCFITKHESTGTEYKPVPPDLVGKVTRALEAALPADDGPLPDESESVRPILDVAKELVASIDYAGPKELSVVVKWLRDCSEDLSKRQSQRRIARELAPVVSKLAK